MNALLELKKEIRNIQDERNSTYWAVATTAWDMGYDSALRLVMMLITQIEAEETTND